MGEDLGDPSKRQTYNMRRAVTWVSMAIPISPVFVMSAFMNPPSKHATNSNAYSTTRKLSERAEEQWTSLDPESIVSASCLIEQTLCQPSLDGSPQLAKDFNYASAVLEAWKQTESDSMTAWQAETRRVAYSDSSGTPLVGHLIRHPTTTQSEASVPGILFFHTGAGPHDLFLLYKAVALINSMPPCVVLIADLLSDETGWGWNSDRSHYEAVQTQLLMAKSDDPHSSAATRPVLQQRIRAAIQALVTSLPNIDSDHLAALGWCFGSHPILELGRMKVKGMRAMVTFHGVFGDSENPSPSSSLMGLNDDDSSDRAQCEILICHGVNDPFVSNQQVEFALETFQKHRHKVSLLQLPAKHGFSNPAQAYNSNPAFEYNKDAADKAWKQAVALLRRTLT